MVSIVPDKTRAILIGASTFPRDPTHLPNLPAVAANITELARLIVDPGVIGIPSEAVEVLLDQSGASQIAERLATRAREAEDTLLIYYAGHGIVGDHGDLFLALGDATEADAEYNALPFDTVRRAISESGARKKILVLDCCFSGRALQMMGPETSMLQAGLDIQGTFAMASAPANKPAMAPEGARYTAFTGELIDVLANGLENGRDTITMAELYSAIRGNLRRTPGRPEPQQANLQDAGQIVIAHNRRLGLEGQLARLRDGMAAQDRRLEEALARMSVATSPHGGEPEPDRSSFRRSVATFIYLAIGSVIAFGDLLICRGQAPGGAAHVVECVLPFAYVGALLGVVSGQALRGHPRIFDLLFGSYASPEGVLRASVLGLVIAGIRVAALTRSA